MKTKITESAIVSSVIKELSKTNLHVSDYEDMSYQDAGSYTDKIFGEGDGVNEDGSGYSDFGKYSDSCFANNNTPAELSYSDYLDYHDY